ncbi:hypothetical protein BDR05DRAFT_947799 [Suillus weaverae]|nr:hypothetical protein BDR05DRAFT_947799 [Suillus weaverae]
MRELSRLLLRNQLGFNCNNAVQAVLDATVEQRLRGSMNCHNLLNHHVAKVHTDLGIEQALHVHTITVNEAPIHPIYRLSSIAAALIAHCWLHHLYSSPSSSAPPGPSIPLRRFGVIRQMEQMHYPGFPMPRSTNQLDERITQSIYGDEKEVGESLHASGVPREEVLDTRVRAPILKCLLGALSAYVAESAARNSPSPYN